jgi:hypothetical protein
MIWKGVLTSGKNGSKTGLSENAGDFGALIALNFNASVLDCATAAAGFLHLFGELFFFGQANADKVFNNRHRLATAMRRLPEDVDATAIFWARGTCARGFMSGSLVRSRGQSCTAQTGERFLAKTFVGAAGIVVFAAHATIYLREWRCALKNSKPPKPFHGELTLHSLYDRQAGSLSYVNLSCVQAQVGQSVLSICRQKMTLRAR